MSDRTHPDSGPGAVYAALPEPITYQIAALKACEHGDALVGWRVEPSRQSFDASMRPKRKLYTEGNMHDFADRTHALRASHGQAPAQAAPAAVEGPVAVLKFERGTPGRQNEMPRVVSCNWMPDGEYEVYLAAAPTTQPAPKQEAQEPVAVVVPCHTPSGKRVALYSAKQDLPIGTQLYTAPQQAGWRLVPLEPTDEMLEATYAGQHCSDVYRDMLAAAPQPSPAAQGDVPESEYRRGYRHGYEQRDAEVRGALA